MKLLLRSATCILSDNIKEKPADYAHVELNVNVGEANAVADLKVKRERRYVESH